MSGKEIQADDADSIGFPCVRESGRMFDVEELDVYPKLCRLHLQVYEHTKVWPHSDRFELTSQLLRSSNSSPAQLAEKNNDRHVRNKLEGVNRAKGEARETIHHLYIASLRGLITES